MKRFTETLKWDDPWFRTLSPEMKCFWSYLVDKCDHAGVWEVDLAAASFFVGAKLDEPKVLKAFGERIERLSNGVSGGHAERWRVIKFIHFQYPNLSRDCKPHGPVFAAIERHGLEVDKVKNGIRSSTSEGKALNTLPLGFESLQDKDQDKDQDQDTETENETEAPQAPTPADTIYAAYPRKVGPKAALKAITCALKTKGTDELLAATQRYASAVALWPEPERHFVPHPATWFNRGSYDDDPSTWIRETKEDQRGRALFA